MILFGLNVIIKKNRVMERKNEKKRISIKIKLYETKKRNEIN